MSRRNPWTDQRTDLEGVHFYHYVIYVGIYVVPSVIVVTSSMQQIDFAVLRGNKYLAILALSSKLHCRCDWCDSLKL